jgi:hypothetical protein
MNVEAFLDKYPSQEPARPSFHPDERRPLGESDGLRLLRPPPPDVEVKARPVKEGDDGLHLWVIDERGIPYLLERASVQPPLHGGKVKHTNLTGGGKAACGGEVWFDPVAEAKVFINGCSGRYGPRTPEQLADAESVFADLGYDVVSFGWNPDANRPFKVLQV